MRVTMTISNGARNQAVALGLDVDQIAAQHSGPSLMKQHVEDYAKARGTVSVQAAVVAPQRCTSQAAALREPDPDDDPLLLDGCRISVKWPHKGETRDRTGVIRFKPLPGKQRRYVVAIERRRGGTRDKKTNWRHLKRREYEVVSSPYQKGRLYTPAELEAAKRRRQAPEPESFKSIGVSLDRTYAGVKSTFRRLCDLASEPAGRKVGGFRPRKDWRGKVILAFEQLPGRRGTSREVRAKIEATLGEHHPALDRSIEPGTKFTTMWEKCVQKTLYSEKDVFARTDEKACNVELNAGGHKSMRSGRAYPRPSSVWQYTPLPLGPPSKRSAKEIEHSRVNKKPQAATKAKKDNNSVRMLGGR